MLKSTTFKGIAAPILLLTTLLMMFIAVVTCSKSTDDSCTLSCNAASDVVSGTSPLTIAFSCTATSKCTPLSYSWQFGDGQTSTAQNPVHTYSANKDTTYVAKVTVTDSDQHFCEKQISIAVTSHTSTLSCNPIAETATGNPPFAVTFHSQVNGGVSPLTYEWSFGDGEISSLSDPVHTYENVGTFYASFTVRDATPEGICRTISPITIVVTCPPVEVACSASDTSGCAPLDVQFSATGSGGCPPLSYLWQFGDGDSSSVQSPSHTFVSTGIHAAVVRATDSKGNRDFDTVSVRIADDDLTCMSDADATSGCAPLDVQFNAGGAGGCPPFTYRWSFGDGQTSLEQNPSHTFLSAGVFETAALVIDARGDSCLATDTIEVTGGSPLSCRILGSLAGSCIPYQSCLEAQVEGGCAPYSYSWAVVNVPSGTDVTLCHEYQSFGDYEVRLVVTDAKGLSCQKSATVKVTTGQRLTCSASADIKSGCAPLATQFSASSSGGCAPMTFSWDFGDGEVSTNQNPTHTYVSNGNYTSTLTVTDAADSICQKTVLISVTGGTPLTCNATVATASGCTPLGASFDVTVGGGCPPYSYAWVFGDGQSSTLKNPKHTYTTAGTFAPTVTVTDAKGLTCGKELALTVIAPIPLTCSAGASVTSGYTPLLVQFNSSRSGGCEPVSLSWNFGDGSTSNEQNPSHAYSSAGTFTATLTATDAQSNLCTRAIAITTYAPLACTSIGASPASGYAPLSVNFTSQVSGGKPPLSLTWNFGDGGTGSGASPSHTYTGIGSFTATMTALDATGASCSRQTVVTANLATYTLSVSANPGGSGTITKSPDLPTYSPGTVVTLTATPAATYGFSNWGGDTLASNNPISVSMSRNRSMSAIFSHIPAMTGPSQPTGDFIVTVTYNFWPALASGQDRIEIERSTNPNSGWQVIGNSPAGQHPTSFDFLNVGLATGTYYFRARVYLGLMRSWSLYSNVLTIQKVQPPTKLRIVNNTSHPIISLMIGGVERFTQYPMGINAGGYYEEVVSPGVYSYRIASGFYDGLTKFEIYIWTGSVTVSQGSTYSLTVINPTIAQLLTQFSSSGYWRGTYYHSGLPYSAAFRFYSGGTFRFYDNGSQVGTGNFWEVSRNPSGFSVTFSVGDNTGILNELYGYFTMSNGPSDWRLIQYYYEGAKATGPGGPRRGPLSLGEAVLEKLDPGK